MGVNWRVVTAFLSGAFLISWLLAGAYYATGWPLKTAPGMAMAVAYMFGPAMAVVLVRRLVPAARALNLGIKWRWNRYFVLAWLAPMVCAMIALGVGLAMPGVSYSPGMEGMFERFAANLPPDKIAELHRQMTQLPIPPFVLVMIQGLVAGISVNAVAAFGEEVGWRGLLTSALAPLGFWRASWVIGIVWGLWHAPLILQGHNYPQHPVVGVAAMVVFCMLLSPLFGYVRERSGSVLAAAVAHGTLNATGGLAIMLLRGGDDLSVGMTGLAGFLVLAAANLVLYGSVRHGAQ